MSNRTKIAAVLALACSIQACGGWYLRGEGPNKFPFETAYVNSANAPKVSTAVRTALVNRGVRVTAQRTEAEVVVELSSENFDRRVLSVDPRTGKVREIELGLQAYFSVHSGDGKLLVPVELVNWQLDYIYDEGSLLGTVEQAQTVRHDLAETAATTLMMRLQAVHLPAAE